VNLISSTGNAIVAKNVNLTQRSSDIAASINVTGNMLVCGEVTGEAYLTFNSGEIIYITDEQYTNYLTSHRITFDANGGTVSVENIVASNDMPVGELPRPSRDYYTFVGWFTEPDGGEEYTAETIMTALADITLYAHWEQNDVSAWVLASEAPADAEIVDTKYSYTQTLYTTSGSSSLSGWNHYDTTWAWSNYGSWSSWQDGELYGSDSRQVETQQVVSGYNMKQVWQYYRARTKDGTKAWCTVSGDCVVGELTGPLDYRLPVTDSHPHCASEAYGKGHKNKDGVSYPLIHWYNEDTWWDYDYNSPIYKTQYRYRDRSKVYTYYFQKDEARESVTYPTGSDISNVQEWVQYRAK
ncbi:MAG: InlB B-repeat-containing protein, partial [Oscillospiraceae bacterium]|nr:InlB B-repeat-containing protein [Oscillospiraceae bacterium]